MPTLTVADARETLGRVIGMLAAIADLDYAMVRSARLRGVSPAATRRLVDADLAGFTADDVDPFLEVAELRAWESILANANDPTLRDAAIDESPSDVRAQAREKIESLSAYVKAVHGVGVGGLTIGTIGLDFQAGADETFEAS